MKRALSLALCLALAACGSSRGEDGPDPAAGGAGPGSGGSAAAAGPAIVRGTVLDASSGRPLAGVLVQGPGATRATSDKDGRFELQHLPVGAAGEIVATAQDGRSGRNRLRAVREGVLEVVLFVR
jgi:hypothetical protein